MKLFLFLTVAIQIASNSNGLPLPAGQIVKYRVPSKYFTKPNETAQDSSSSLYSFLSQIHYGGSSPSVTMNTNEILLENISNENDAVADKEAAAETSTNESPEATNDVTDQQMDAVKVNDDSLQSLIEKVVNDELKKLAHEKSQIIAVEVIKHSSVPFLNMVSSKNKISSETTTSFDEQNTTEQTELSDTTESANLDSETVLPTIPPTVAPAVEELQRNTEESETTTNDSQPSVDDDDDDDHVSDSLLSAVGDLLSSILGLDVDDKISVESNDESDAAAESQLLTSTETYEIEQGTEKVDDASTTPAGYEGEEESSEAAAAAEIPDVTTNPSQDKPANEIDVKIENLAIAQTSFATENTPEQFAETVRDDTAPEAFQVISVKSNEQPDSIEQRINQVMDLVKGTEGRLALQSMGNVVDSTLIDKEMKNDMNDLAQIVYGTLKEAQLSFGLNDDSEKTSNSFSPTIHEDLIRNFEMEINDSLVNKNHFDHETFVPNSAKAALRYKHQDNEDF